MIDIQEFKNNLTNFNNQHLCEIIISYQYLNFYQEIVLLAMEELALRRKNGDIFNYEDYIETKIKDLPNFKQRIDPNTISFWKTFDLQNLIKNYAKK